MDDCVHDVFYALNVCIYVHTAMPCTWVHIPYRHNNMYYEINGDKWFCDAATCADEVSQQRYGVYVHYTDCTAGRLGLQTNATLTSGSAECVCVYSTYFVRGQLRVR